VERPISLIQLVGVAIASRRLTLHGEVLVLLLRLCSGAAFKIQHGFHGNSVMHPEGCIKYYGLDKRKAVHLILMARDADPIQRCIGEPKTSSLPITPLNAITA
jgi:hypothetical protein